MLLFNINAYWIEHCIFSYNMVYGICELTCNIWHLYHFKIFICFSCSLEHNGYMCCFTHCLFVRERCSKQALELLGDMCGSGVQPNIVVYNCFMGIAIREILRSMIICVISFLCNHCA
jgi:pentatricopeptide repeat protein